MTTRHSTPLDAPTTAEAATPSPLHDPARLAEIAELELLSVDADPTLQAIAADAAASLGLPMACVSIVLDDAQLFVASRGLEGWLGEAAGTPVEWSFCATSVRTREAFVVEDATTHPDVRDNPLVAEDGVRCYAGMPLISSRGHVLGNFCVIGTEERSFTAGELAELRGFADRVIAHVEARRAKTTS